MSDCPAQDQLALLLAEQLSGPDLARVESHVQTCASCQEVLTALSSADGPASGRPGEAEAPNRDEPRSEFLRRLREVSLAPGDTPEEGNAVEPTLPLPDAGTVAGQRWPAVAGYEILGELGRGGMGIVYKARQRGLNRLVALKMIPAGAQAGEGELVRFQAEAEAVARLRHANIVQVHEVGAHEGGPFFSMEFCEGGSLADLLRGAPQSARESAELVETLARAVQHAHERGVLHRDLKPANILLQEDSAQRRKDAKEEDEENDGGRQPSSALLSSSASLRLCASSSLVPKIADFGLAKRLDVHGPSQSGPIVGTPSYMAPEQAAGKGTSVGPAADVWALGAILYECLTGRVPFIADTPLDTLLQVLAEDPLPPSRLAPKVPRDLETVCLKCLHKEPRRRYGSATELADDLHRFLNNEPVHARPVSAWERGIKWARRRPAAAALIGVSILAAIALLTVGLVYDARLGVALHDVHQAQAAAEGQRQAASAANVDAQRALTAAQDNFYFSQVLLAQQRWQANDVAGAEESLNACDPGRRRWEWHYLQHLCRLDRLTLRAAPKEACCVAFSPDGTRLVTGGGSTPWATAPGVLKVWDANTGRLRLLLEGHRGLVTSVAFSPDGKLLASASQDLDVLSTFREAKPQTPTPRGEVILWDAATGKRLRTLEGHSCVAFGPDSKLLATAGFDQSVKVFDANTGMEVFTLPGHSGRVVAVAFSLDGQRLASASKDFNRDAAGKFTTRAQVKVWDVTGRRETFALPAAVGEVTYLAFHPDGKRLAIAGVDQTVRVWDVAGGRELLTLRGHAGGVDCVAFSPDGKSVASASLDQTVRVWDADSGQERVTLRGHVGPVHAVTFAPGGAGLASAGGDGLVKCWDLDAGRNPLALRGHTAGVGCVRFSPDRTRLASTSIDEHKVRVWDARSGQELCTLSCDALTVDFSPDGKRLATAGGNAFRTGEPGELKVWDLDERRPVLDLAGHTRFVAGVAFDPNGRFLASVSADPRGNRPGELKVWDAATGKELLSLPQAANYVNGLAFSPDGLRVALASLGNEVEVVEALTGKTLAHLPTPAAVLCVAFSPDSRWLAAGGAGMLLVWDGDGARPPRELRGHAGLVNGLAFSPDGERLAAATFDENRGTGEVQLWDVARGKPVLSLPGQVCVAFSPDGRLAAAGRDQLTAAGVVQVWDATPGPEVFTLLPRCRGLVTVACDPAGTGVATGGDAEDATVWDAQTGEERVRLRGNTGGVYSVAFSPDGERLAVACGDRVVRQWSVAGGLELASLRGHEKEVFRLQFSPDGRHLATASWDQTVKLWDAATGAEEATLRGHTGRVWSMAYAPDGKALATGGADKTVRAWDVATRAEVHRFEGAKGPVFAVAYSPDGKQLAAASSDETVVVRDPASGATLFTCVGHAGWVRCLAYSPDGKLLASGSRDRTVKVWDAATGRERLTLRGHVEDVMGVDFMPDGRRLATASLDGTVKVWDLAAAEQEDRPERAR